MVKLEATVAQAEVLVCAGDGCNVSAAVTDRSGVRLALVRSENSGLHTANASARKAFTSASSHKPTGAIAENVSKNPVAARVTGIPGFLVRAGDVPIKFRKDAVGVADAPGADLWEVYANKAIEKVSVRKY